MKGSNRRGMVLVEGLIMMGAFMLFMILAAFPLMALIVAVFESWGFSEFWVKAALNVLMIAFVWGMFFQEIFLTPLRLSVFDMPRMLASKFEFLVGASSRMALLSVSGLLALVTFNAVPMFGTLEVSRQVLMFAGLWQLYVFMLGMVLSFVGLHLGMRPLAVREPLTDE